MSGPAGRRRVLVVEGGPATHALAAVRALGTAGWDVGLAVAGDDSRAARSRHVRRVWPVPSAQDDLDGFVDATVDAAAGYDVLLTCDDIELVALSAARERLPCVFPHAAHADVLHAIDKLELARAAERAGLGAPATRPADDAALGAVHGPVVVKARWHFERGAAGGVRFVEATWCRDGAEARAAARAMRDAGREPVLQDAVDGELMALTAVLDPGGAPVGWCQQRTSRMSGRRTSSRAETTALDAGLAAGVERLLGDLRWIGLANVQFLRPPGGVPQLIDLNGRLYGSVALAVAAGVNVPDLWARTALGLPVAGVAVARPGVRFQALGEDLARARRERRGGLARDVADTALQAARSAQARSAVRDLRPGAEALAGQVRQRLGRSRAADGAPGAGAGG